VSAKHLVIQWIDGNVQCRIVPLHLLSVLHVHLDRTLLRRADASHSEYDQEHKESDADNGNHCNSSTYHTGMWLLVQPSPSISKKFHQVGINSRFFGCVIIIFINISLQGVYKSSLTNFQEIFMKHLTKSQ